MNDPFYTLIYNLIYSSVTTGEDDVLFGKRNGMDIEVFAKSFAGNDFPEVWFEIPLAGDPWYDLHILTSKRALADHKKCYDGICYPHLFKWFAKSSGVRQLALSYDLSKGVYDTPAAQLLVSKDDPSTGCDFLSEAGNPDAAEAYKRFADRLPKNWFACYVGTFPGRDDVNLRVECIPDERSQAEYCVNRELLRADLAQVGFEISDEMLNIIMLMARQPVGLEFQFNVEESGYASPILGASLRFQAPDTNGSSSAFLQQNENVASLMGELEHIGLVDNRWHVLSGRSFAKRLSKGDESICFAGFPAFIKIRLKPDEPIDAKAYIVSNVY